MTIVEYFLKEYENFRTNIPKHINRQDWEESLQDTYFGLLRIKEDVSYKKTYINTAVRRNTVHLVDKRKTIGSRLAQVKVHTEITNITKSPEELLIDKQEEFDTSNLHLWIAELPKKQRMIMEDVISGLTVAEAGRKRKLNTNTTKHNYLIALKKLKQKAGAAW